MLTLKTQKVLAILHDISIRSDHFTAKFKMNEGEVNSYLRELEKADLIHLQSGEPGGSLSSYNLSRSLSRISLLSLLNAINEHLNCNQPLTEEFYNLHGAVAQKLGVVHQVTRSVLNEISVLECI